MNTLGKKHAPWHPRKRYQHDRGLVGLKSQNDLPIFHRKDRQQEKLRHGMGEADGLVT